jgi:cell wall-associated NlpC family hydrolase
MTVNMKICRLLALALLLGGCGLEVPALPPGNRSAAVDGSIDGILQHQVDADGGVSSLARECVGAPYRYGGDGPEGFDCSGLVQYVFGRSGLRVPRTSTEQYLQAQRVPLEELQPGDLLFFRVSRQKVSHVGIYIEGNTFIHAPSSGSAVCYATLENPYWQTRLQGAGRYPRKP